MQSKLVDALAVGELSWQDYANCRGADADLFFPERGASTRKAKAICGACEVKGECLDYAIEMGEKFGIWGGLSERERRRVRRERQHRGVSGSRELSSASPQVESERPSADSTAKPECRETLLRASRSAAPGRL